MIDISEVTFQWLRPLWLWGFVPLVLLLGFRLRRTAGNSAWEQLVDPQLQPYVIDGEASRKNRTPWLLFAAWALSLLMLAGPVWEQQEVPVFQAPKAEVVLFDLSRSMFLDDVAPDRLTRARFKLADLLARSEGLQLGLIGFSERPYVISPLTEDTGNIEVFLPSLSPDIMPAQGSRLDLAIERATTLFTQAGVQQGHILYIGDQNINERDISAAQSARESGHRVSVLVVGTAAGKPLRDQQGQFVKDASGAIVVPQIDLSKMRKLANAGGGKAVSLTTGADDLDELTAVRASVAIEAGDSTQATQKIYWVEYSPFLIWVLMFAALWMFRRGVLT